MASAGFKERKLDHWHVSDICGFQHGSRRDLVTVEGMCRPSEHTQPPVCALEGVIAIVIIVSGVHTTENDRKGAVCPTARHKTRSRQACMRIGKLDEQG